MCLNLNYPPLKEFAVICCVTFHICEVRTLLCLVMECYTVQERVFIIKSYYRYRESVAETVRKFRGEIMLHPKLLLQSYQGNLRKLVQYKMQDSTVVAFQKK